jgi:hypothetical protein
LQTVRCAQGILIQQLRRHVAQFIVGKDFPPTTAEHKQTNYGSLFIEIGNRLTAMKPTKRAVNFDQAPPPDDQSEFI